jgi:CheY-like chemotaxis protein/predicted regulator of Ras-like GTPase activity (Roadblock/LC7/MglB family)
MQKVLVIDDSLSVRKVVEKALEGRGLQVLAAASGAEAIQLIDRDRPDVVICDVVLPDKDGYQICQYVRAHPAVGATPFLLISGIDNGTVQARAAEVRSDEVMFKPFGVDDLVRKIDALLAKRPNGTKPAASAPSHAAVKPLVVTVSASAPASTPAPSPVSSPASTSAPAPTTVPVPPSVPASPFAPASTSTLASASGPVATSAAAPMPARAPAPVPVTAPAPASASVTAPTAAVSRPPAAAADQSLKERLQGLAGTPGVRFAVLTDREGFLIETAGDLAPDADEVAGALASCLAEASDGIGRELGQGQLVGTILEYESGILLLHGVGRSALLAVLVGDQGALGKVRYYVRKTVPELVRAL